MPNCFLKKRITESNPECKQLKSGCLYLNSLLYMCHLLGRATLAPDLFMFSELRALPRPTECTSPSAGMLCFATQSCLTLCDPMDCSLPGTSVRGILQARTLEWVALPSSRGSNRPPGFPHCRWILYHLSHQGRPEMPEWAAYPFSRGSSQPRN